MLTEPITYQQVQKAAYNVVAIQAQQLRNLNSNAADMLPCIGVKMRETGGVGAEANINLNGFTGRHVRIFIDGVPMNEANASFRINNIPAELIERIPKSTRVWCLLLLVPMLLGALSM